MLLFRGIVGFVIFIAMLIILAKGFFDMGREYERDFEDESEEQK